MEFLLDRHAMDKSDCAVELYYILLLAPSLATFNTDSFVKLTFYTSKFDVSLL
jgi:hypothetical protein